MSVLMQSIWRPSHRGEFAATTALPVPKFQVPPLAAEKTLTNASLVYPGTKVLGCPLFAFCGDTKFPGPTGTSTTLGSLL
jgi:hypothetical protein